MSAKAWTGQQNYILKLRTGIDFTQYSPSAVAIQYRFMGRDISEWPAAVSTGEEADGVIQHDFSVQAPVSDAGTYRIRGKLTIAGKLVYTEAADWVVGEF